MRDETSSLQSLAYAKYGGLFYRFVGIILAVLLSIFLTKLLRFMIDKLGDSVGGIFHTRHQSYDDAPEDYTVYLNKIQNKIKELSSIAQQWIRRRIHR